MAFRPEKMAFLRTLFFLNRVAVFELASKKMGSFLIFCPVFSVCSHSQVQAIVTCRQGVAAVGLMLYFVFGFFFTYGHGFGPYSCLLLIVGFRFYIRIS
jgi:hypothetical protein